MTKLLILLSAGFLFISCNDPVEASAEKDVQKQEISDDTTHTTRLNASLTKVWETDTVLPTNESVLFYPPQDVLFVSSTAGKPTARDGRGFISKLSTTGEMKTRKWVTGLDAPKGMDVLNTKLYVTNIDELVKIDISSGKIEKRYPVQGASFLNDVVAAEGVVYFSDMKTGKLHKLERDSVSTVKSDFVGINGLAYHDQRLYMLTEHGLQKMVEDKALVTVNDSVTGGDGLVALGDSSFLASRWKGEIWLIRGNKAVKLLDSKDQDLQTADIGYVPEKKLVLVPRFFGNKVTAYKLNY